MSFRLSTWALILLIGGFAFWATHEQVYAQQAPATNTPVAQRPGLTIITPGPAVTAVPVTPEPGKQRAAQEKLPQAAKPTPTPAKPTPPPVRKPLTWVAPPTPHVLLQAGATITNNIATYTIYPINMTTHGIWDLHITIPVPAGASFLVATAPNAFIAGFDGHNVFFSATELPAQGADLPLRFQLAVPQVTTPVLTTAVSATWRYVENSLGASVFTQEATKSGDLTLQPHGAQQMLADAAGDVPFGSYDLTGVTLEQDQSSMKITLDTAGNVGPVGAGHNEYNVYIDNDCNANTGNQQRGLGIDYRIRYQHDKGLASLNVWDKTATVTDTTTLTSTGSVTTSQTVTNGAKTGGWRVIGSLSAIGPPNGHSVTIWVPHALLTLGAQVCWSADAQDRTDEYLTRPIPDQMPESGSKLLLTRYSPALNEQPLPITTPITETIGYTNNGALRLVRVITPTLALTPPDFSTLQGKLALSLVNDQNSADIHLFALADGQEITKIANASRPTFRPDGQHLLISRSDGTYEYTLADNTEIRLSSAVSATHPFYNARGTGVVYENVALTNTAQSANGSKAVGALFRLCDLIPAQPGAPLGCRLLPDSNALATTPLPGELRGAQPVWTANDTIVYQGCASWLQPDNCGLFYLRAAHPANNNELFLRQLTHHADDLPTDAKGNVVVFTSQATGDWEVYAMRLDGAWVKNLSQNPKAQDVLPTISPDGNWVAFVSNRSGKWAVWAMPMLGGEPHKLFDLPGDKPWGEQEQSWQEQRLSWGY